MHMPLITYVVAQADHGIRIVPKVPTNEKDHGIRIVPKVPTNEKESENVPYGTCMDSTIVSSSGDGNPNFLLVPQHGASKELAGPCITSVWRMRIKCFLVISEAGAPNSLLRPFRS